MENSNVEARIFSRKKFDRDQNAYIKAEYVRTLVEKDFRVFIKDTTQNHDAKKIVIVKGTTAKDAKQKAEKLYPGCKVTHAVATNK